MPVAALERFTEQQLALVLRFTRAELNRVYGLSAGKGPKASSLPGVSFDKINITIRRDGRLRASMSDRGPGLAKAIASAVRKCSRDGRFGSPLTAEEIPHSVVELWVQTGAEPLDISTSNSAIEGFDTRASMALTSA